MRVRVRGGVLRRHAVQSRGVFLLRRRAVLVAHPSLDPVRVYMHVGPRLQFPIRAVCDV